VSRPLGVLLSVATGPTVTLTCVFPRFEHSERDATETTLIAVHAALDGGRYERQPLRKEMKKLLPTGIAVLLAISAAYAAEEELPAVVVSRIFRTFGWLSGARLTRRWYLSPGPSATRCLDISWSTTPCRRCGAALRRQG